MAQSAAELFPLGKASLRPMQWLLADVWSPLPQEWDLPPFISQAAFHDAMRIWADMAWVSQGVPLQLDPPTVTLYNDASLTGWGAHLLPEFRSAHGLWEPTEGPLHINLLEMLTVERALHVWREVLRGQHVLLLTDNTTVCSYLQWQGGMKSRDLCLLAVRVVQGAHANNVTLSIHHIPGRLNVIADGLSKAAPWRRSGLSIRRSSIDCGTGSQTYRWTCSPHDSIIVFFFCFVSPFPDLQALAVDGLGLDWEGGDLDALHPSSLIPTILKRLTLFTCSMTFIAPLNWRRSWTTCSGAPLNPPSSSQVSLSSTSV